MWTSGLSPQPLCLHILMKILHFYPTLTRLMLIPLKVLNLERPLVRENLWLVLGTRIFIFHECCVPLKELLDAPGTKSIVLQCQYNYTARYNGPEQKLLWN